MINSSACTRLAHISTEGRLGLTFRWWGRQSKASQPGEAAEPGRLWEAVDDVRYHGPLRVWPVHGVQSQRVHECMEWQHKANGRALVTQPCSTVVGDC